MMNKQKILDIEDSKLKEQLAEFIGWHLGDGCISVNSRYSEYALTGDLVEEYQFYKKVILPTFNQVFSRVLYKPIKLKKYKSNGVCGIYIFEKVFVNYLRDKFGLKAGKKLNVEIPEYIGSKAQKIAFLRGIFDTDGSIYYCKSNFKTKNKSLFTEFHYKPKIKLATISRNLIEGVHSILIELGFHPRLRKPAKQRENENTMYGVVLYRNADVKRYIEEIGFKNIKHQSKIEVANLFGFCPPKTTLKQRISILKSQTNPLEFYPKNQQLDLREIKQQLLIH